MSVRSGSSNATPRHLTFNHFLAAAPRRGVSAREAQLAWCQLVETVRGCSFTPQQAIKEKLTHRDITAVTASDDTRPYSGRRSAPWQTARQIARRLPRG